MDQELKFIFPTNAELDKEIKRLDKEIAIEIERITADMYRMLNKSIDNIDQRTKELLTFRNQIEREYCDDRA